MTRGCASDNDAAKEHCDSLGTTGCRYCDAATANGCNSMAAMIASSLSCIQCTAAEECKWGQPAAKATACTALIPFTSTEQCYTSSVGDVVVRGCSLEATPEQCTTPTSCTYCAGAGCNGQNVVTQSCLNCKTNEEGQNDCREAGSTQYSAVCKANELLEYADRGCYTRNDGTVLALL